MNFNIIVVVSLFSLFINVVNSLPYDHIALEGGGSKAISYIGSLLAFKEYGYYKHDRYTFEKIGGTSAGCLMGFLMSLDIEPSKLEKFVYTNNIFQQNLDFSDDLLDSPPEKSSEHTWFNTILKTFDLILKAREVVDLWLNFNSPGLSSAEKFINFVSNEIYHLSPHAKLLGNARNLTFQKLYDVTQHDLRCFATQLVDKTIYEFSVQTTPDEYVLKGIYSSMTVPGLFKPLTDAHGNTLIDGGLLYNFPITMNDNTAIDHTTLGLSLAPCIQKEQSLAHRYTDNVSLDSAFTFKEMETIDYFAEIYSIIINREVALYTRNSHNDNRVIYLDSPLDTFDFKLDSREINMAINKAYLNTLTFLQKKGVTR